MTIVCYSRLFIRGIDDNGRVANYVETEQIVQLPDVACSYVQVNTDLHHYVSKKST